MLDNIFSFLLNSLITVWLCSRIFSCLSSFLLSFFNSAPYTSFYLCAIIVKSTNYSLLANLVTRIFYSSLLVVNNDRLKNSRFYSVWTENRNYDKKCSVFWSLRSKWKISRFPKGKGKSSYCKGSILLSCEYTNLHTLHSAYPLILSKWDMKHWNKAMKDFTDRSDQLSSPNYFK